MPSEFYKHVTEEMMRATAPSLIWKAMSPQRLDQVLPELGRCKQVFQRSGEKVFDHIMKVLDRVSLRNPVTLWGAVFHDVGKECGKGTIGLGFAGHDVVSAGIAAMRMAQWGAPRHESSCVSRIADTHMFDAKHVTAKGLRQFVARVGIDNIENWFVVRKADVAAYAHHIPDFLAEFERDVKAYVASLNSIQYLNIKIDEQDLIEMFGDEVASAKLLAMVVEGVRSGTYPNSREALIELVRSLVQTGAQQ